MGGFFHAGMAEGEGGDGGKEGGREGGREGGGGTKVVNQMKEGSQPNKRYRIESEVQCV